MWVTWRPRGLSKSVKRRVITRVTPFRVLITLRITHLLSPPGPPRKERLVVPILHWPQNPNPGFPGHPGLSLRVEDLRA